MSCEVHITSFYDVLFHFAHPDMMGACWPPARKAYALNGSCPYVVGARREYQNVEDPAWWG